jgi:hypothetical protein
MTITTGGHLLPALRARGVQLHVDWLISPNVGWLLISTTTSMYLIYEFMHLCYHVDGNWFVHHMLFVNTLRRRHTAHHKPVDHDGTAAGLFAVLRSANVPP